MNTEETDTILNDYYTKKLKVSVIVKKYDLLTSSSIYKKFPHYEHRSIKCEFCTEKLISRYLSREEIKKSPQLDLGIKDKKPRKEKSNKYSDTAINRRTNNNNMQSEEGYSISFPYCSSCKHQPTDICQCENCKIVKLESQKSIASSLSMKLKNIIPSSKQLENVNSTLLFELQLFLKNDNDQETDNISFTGHSNKAINGLIESGLITIIEKSIIDTIIMKSTNEYAINMDNLTYTINYDLFNTDKPETEIKHVFQTKLLSKVNHPEVLELWSNVALDEALNVLKYYCEIYNLNYSPGEKTCSIITKSLNKYGLAQTARYILNATRWSNTKKQERKLDRIRAFNLFCGSMSFWVDNETPRDWHAPPFIRDDKILKETKESIVFSHSFLNFYSINYFTDPINMDSLKPSL